MVARTVQIPRKIRTDYLAQKFETMGIGNKTPGRCPVILRSIAVLISCPHPHFSSLSITTVYSRSVGIHNRGLGRKTDK
jgi:hypothetical protein